MHQARARRGRSGGLRPGRIGGPQLIKTETKIIGSKTCFGLAGFKFQSPHTRLQNINFDRRRRGFRRFKNSSNYNGLPPQGPQSNQAATTTGPNLLRQIEPPKSAGAGAISAGQPHIRRQSRPPFDVTMRAQRRLRVPRPVAPDSRSDPFLESDHSCPFPPSSSPRCRGARPGSWCFAQHGEGQTSPGWRRQYERGE